MPLPVAAMTAERQKRVWKVEWKMEFHNLIADIAIVNNWAGFWRPHSNG